MELLQNDETRDKNGINVPHLETAEVVLVHFSIVNNDYQQGSRVLYIFVPNKSFGQLLQILPNIWFMVMIKIVIH